MYTERLLCTDRYEKRHKNLAAHVSPAFRVELGDVVTVGAFEPRGRVLGSTDEDLRRSMPTAVENGAFQRLAGGEEQGGGEDLWQVLSLGVGHEDDVAMLYIHFSVPILCYACIKMTTTSHARCASVYDIERTCA